MIRLTVHFTGHVQGVGFRYTARNIAMGHPVAGYVQNLPEGGVRLVVEGDEAHVRAYVEEVQQAMAQFIRQAGIDSGPASGEFGVPGPGRLGIRY